MAYAYPTSQMVVDVQTRLNDLRPTLSARWPESRIRKAIVAALRWSDPLGELLTFQMDPSDYAAAPQTTHRLLEVLQVETRPPAAPQVIIPPSLWNFQRGQQQVLRLTYQPTSETLIITAMVQNDTDEMTTPGETATLIKIDPMTIELYAAGYLFEQDTQNVTVGSTLAEEQKVLSYTQQAEQRKLTMLNEIRQVYQSIQMPIVEDTRPVSSTRGKRR